MSDFLEHLTEYSDFAPNEAAWGAYMDRFMKSSPEHRQAEMRAFDQFVDQNDKLSRATREASDVLTRRRELTSIHDTMRKLGR